MNRWPEAQKTRRSEQQMIRNPAENGSPENSKPYIYRIPTGGKIRMPKDEQKTKNGKDNQEIWPETTKGQADQLIRKSEVQDQKTRSHKIKTRKPKFKTNR